MENRNRIEIINVNAIKNKNENRDINKHIIKKGLKNVICNALLQE